MIGDMIAADEFRKAFAIPTVAEIVSNWEVSNYEWRTLRAADGTPVSVAAKLIDPFNRSNQFIVMQDCATGAYSVQCPSFRGHWGQRVIDAMKVIVANRKARAN